MIAATSAGTASPIFGNRKKIAYSCNINGVPRRISTYSPSGLARIQGPYIRPTATKMPIRIASGMAVTDSSTVMPAASTSVPKSLQDFCERRMGRFLDIILEIAEREHLCGAGKIPLVVQLF